MRDPNQPLHMTLPEDIYGKAVKLFEKDGASLDDAITQRPRLAYAVLRLCIRDVLLQRTTTMVDQPHNVTVDRKQDGDQAFNAIAESALEILPELIDEEDEVIIRIIRNPSLFQRIKRNRKEPEPEVALQFQVPPAD
jgi:hypothetical protein